MAQTPGFNDATDVDVKLKAQEGGDSNSNNENSRSGSRELPRPVDVRRLCAVELTSPPPSGQGQRSRTSFCEEEAEQQEEQPPTLPAPRQQLKHARGYYKEMLLRRGEELLQASAEFKRYTEETGQYLKHIKCTAPPRMARAQCLPDIELDPLSPAAESLKERNSLAESEVDPPQEKIHEQYQGEEQQQEPLLQETGHDISTPMTSSLAPLPSSVTGKVGFRAYFRELLLRNDEELRNTAASFDHYAEDTAKHFKCPPPDLPPHLMNNFGGDNVIAARPHKGRMDVVRPSIAVSKDTNRSDAYMSGALLAFQRGESGASLQQMLQPQWTGASAENPPRFTVMSLPNGDLRERDALDGYAYWDMDEPTETRRVLPSRLLDERRVEALHNYHFYSHRWRALLGELASALGGEEGAELLRRYEAREDSLPLPPKCQRAFYESIVDYDQLLDEQERIMARVEHDLAEYHAQLLDGPMA